MVVFSCLFLLCSDPCSSADVVLKPAAPSPYPGLGNLRCPLSAALGGPHARCCKAKDVGSLASCHTQVKGFVSLELQLTWDFTAWLGFCSRGAFRELVVLEFKPPDAPPHNKISPHPGLILWRLLGIPNTLGASRTELHGSILLKTYQNRNLLLF